jgi:hypothetical protein
MKKRLLVLAILLLSGFSAFPQAPVTDTTEIIGIYTLTTLQNDDSTFGYEILIADSLVEKHVKKFFITGASGFIERDNAMRAGRWFVDELTAGRNNKYALSIPRARELGITEIDLTN